MPSRRRALPGRERDREGSGPDPLGRGKATGHLREGEGIAAGALDQPGRHRIGQVRGQEAGGLGRRQPGQGEHGQPLQRHCAGRPGAQGEQERHRVAAQPPGGEQQRRRRLLVDPL